MQIKRQMEPTISYHNYMYLWSSKRRYPDDFIFRCLLTKGEKENEENKENKGRLDGSNDRGILEK